MMDNVFKKSTDIMQASTEHRGLRPQVSHCPGTLPAGGGESGWDRTGQSLSKIHGNAGLGEGV